MYLKWTIHRRRMIIMILIIVMFSSRMIHERVMTKQIEFSRIFWPKTFSFLFPKNVKEYKLEYCVFTIKEDIVCCYPRRYLICILCNIIFRKLDLVIDQVPNPGFGIFWCALNSALSQKMANVWQKKCRKSGSPCFFYPIFGNISGMYYPKIWF